MLLVLHSLPFDGKDKPLNYDLKLHYSKMNIPIVKKAANSIEKHNSVQLA